MNLYLSTCRYFFPNRYTILCYQIEIHDLFKSFSKQIFLLKEKIYFLYILMILCLPLFLQTFNNYWIYFYVTINLIFYKFFDLDFYNIVDFYYNYVL